MQTGAASWQLEIRRAAPSRTPLQHLDISAAGPTRSRRKGALFGCSRRNSAGRPGRPGPAGEGLGRLQQVSICSPFSAPGASLARPAGGISSPLAAADGGGIRPADSDPKDSGDSDGPGRESSPSVCLRSRFSRGRVIVPHHPLQPGWRHWRGRASDASATPALNFKSKYCQCAGAHNPF